LAELFPKAVKELQQLPDTVVGEMANSAIDKAKGVETQFRVAGNRTAETSKEGTPEGRDMNATIQLVRLRKICVKSAPALIQNRGFMKSGKGMAGQSSPRYWTGTDTSLHVERAEEI
jgi:hypothetical protein